VPEGDTLVRVATRLRPALAGRRLVRFEAPRLRGARPEPGTAIEAVEARGKHLLVHFAGGLSLRTHLRMSGSWHLYRVGERWRRPAGRLRVLIEADNGWQAVCFDAPDVETYRRPAAERADASSADAPATAPAGAHGAPTTEAIGAIGAADASAAAAEEAADARATAPTEPAAPAAGAEGAAGARATVAGGATVAGRATGPARAVTGAAALDRLGPDLCRPDADLDAVLARLARLGGEVEVGDALLDQRVAAGIGNVYKSEACFARRLDPFTPLAALDGGERRRLYATAHRMLRANLGAGRRRTHGGGLAVYGKPGRPCPRCATPIRVRRQGPHARPTYWCPGCQGRPS
jgi:formamidopyrimidine-DNA glycosylase